MSARARCADFWAFYPIRPVEDFAKKKRSGGRGVISFPLMQSDAARTDDSGENPVGAMQLCSAAAFRTEDGMYHIDGLSGGFRAIYT
ncbi:hypothetical protein AA21952_3409 [Acetobacter oeni LMG 21952]|nr:hypothetical protein AA21952_3409 [Acetobacter oeni LMG 21952]